MRCFFDKSVSCRGFSIIELMIVLLLVGMALTRAIPFTVDWVNSARISEAEATLIEVVGLAKATALRNPAGVIDGEAVSSVCLSDSVF